GGAVPVQSQEMICGGRYLSCDAAMRVFAAGDETNQMQIEVRWRSGRRSVVEGVKANRIYEVDEASAEESSKLKAQSSREAPITNHQSRITNHQSRITNSPPFFEDVSHLIRHTHHEEEFNGWRSKSLNSSS